MSRIVRLLKTPKLNYRQGLLLQEYIINNNKLIDSSKMEDEDFRDVLILTEHCPVYTIGIRTKDYTTEDEERLRKLGADFYKTNRGGLITFHGPGQLVAYPILNLKHFEPSMRWYVRQLENTVIAVCKEFNVAARTTADTGIWVEGRKICSIGVHGSRYIASHGLALNCNVDLKWFDHIVPCGLEGKTMTSLSDELKTGVGRKDVAPIFRDCFSKCFDCSLVDFDEWDLKKIFQVLKVS